MRYEKRFVPEYETMRPVASFWKIIGHFNEILYGEGNNSARIEGSSESFHWKMSRNKFSPFKVQEDCYLPHFSLSYCKPVHFY